VGDSGVYELRGDAKEEEEDNDDDSDCLDE
jgi:hypothetical protein